MNTQSFNPLGKLIVLIVKTVLGLSLVLFFLVGIPLIIDWLYDFPEPLIYTEWGPSELLNYYGTILGTTVTVLTFYLGIRNEFRKKRKDEISQRQLDVIVKINSAYDEMIKNSLPSRLILFHHSIKVDYVRDRAWFVDVYKRSQDVLAEAYESIVNCGLLIDSLFVVGLDRDPMIEFQKQIASNYKKVKKKNEELLAIYKVHSDKDEKQREQEYVELFNTIGEYVDIFCKYAEDLILIKRKATAYLMGLKNSTIEDKEAEIYKVLP